MLSLIDPITIMDLQPIDIPSCDWGNEGPTPAALEAMVNRSAIDNTVRVLAGYTSDSEVAVVGAIDFLSPYRPEIQMIATKPTERKKGYATAILKALEAEAIRRSVPSVQLSVDPLNLQAHHLYSALGYEHSHERMDGRWELGASGAPEWTEDPIIVMIKLL